MARPIGNLIRCSAVVLTAIAMPLTALAASGTLAARTGTNPPAAHSGTEQGAATAPGARHNSPEIRQAQEALNKNGANLSVDGKLGPKTRTAIENFQKAHNLNSTGKLDAPTETALNLR